MIDLSAALAAFGGMLVLGLAGWLWSIWRRDVSIVDSLWALFYLLGVAIYAGRTSGFADARTMLVLALVAVWAARLSGYLTWRNWGEPEDRRYAAMRAKRGESFWWRSAYVVFGLQAVLAAVIAAPLLVAVGSAASPSAAPLGLLDYAGATLWLVGFLFEAVGDAQLARFKADPANRGRVLDRGLWRYTRHPNYFGDACVWWGYHLIAAGVGGAWSVFSPLLMTLLLIKVSGVAMLERDIDERRPAYREYIERTSPFLPWFPRRRGAA
jgi:steroid 5-alpha reductase family enzyme